MDGARQLCEARIELLEGEGDERERLLVAARCFLAAVERGRRWPPELRVDAEALKTRLLRRGTPEASVAEMNEETLRHVSDLLWRFCEVAEPCHWDAAGAQVRGIEHLREARAALHGAEGDVRDRLQAAVRGFRAAVLHAGAWPAGLREKAEAVTARLFREPNGKPEDAVRRVGDKTAGEISLDILGICDDAEEVEGNGPRPTKPH